VCNATAITACNAEQAQPAASVTQRPTLTGVTRVTNQPNVFVFAFDHSVGLAGSTPADFKVYRSTDASPTTGTTATQVSPNSVQVTFSATAITQSNANLWTVGAVTDGPLPGTNGTQPTAGAVFQNNGTTTLPNTIGSATISGGAAITTGSANGPILLSATASINSNQVTYGFSLPITPSSVTAAAFFLVGSAGNGSVKAGTAASVNGNSVVVTYAPGSVTSSLVGAGVTSPLGAQAPIGSVAACKDANGDTNAPGDVAAVAS
jgi:hypothetical protein